MHHQNTGNETSTAARGTLEGFFMSWFVRGKSCLFKTLLQGTGKQSEEQRPSDLLEWLAVAQPPCLVCRKPAMQTPNVQPSSEEVMGQTSSAAKAMRMLLTMSKVQGAASSPSIRRTPDRSSETGGQRCCV